MRSGRGGRLLLLGRFECTSVLGCWKGLRPRFARRLRRPSTILRALAGDLRPQQQRGRKVGHMLKIYPVALELIRQMVRQGSLAKEELMK